MPSERGREEIPPTLERPSILSPRESELLGGLARMRREVGRAIVGQEEVLEELLLALLAGGHALLVGVPGLAKTLMVRSIARATALEFRRIQFTPDLVPTDVTGSEVMEEDRSTGTRSFRFSRGPIFANLVLADEINRAPPRTQAAMLEAMQERNVSAAGETMALPEPFFVLATQNPIEQEGTYPLPEAQLDRFLFNIRVGYPPRADEIAILRATTAQAQEELRPVIDGASLSELIRLTREVAAPEPALEYVADLVRASRPDEPGAPEAVRRYVRWGAGPRAGQALVLGAKAHALMDGRINIEPADVGRVLKPVLRHRVLPNFAAEAEGISVEALLDALDGAVEPPGSRVAVA